MIRPGGGGRALNPDAHGREGALKNDEQLGQIGRRTILVVDDEQLVRKTISLIVERRTGYRVLGAADGDQAGKLFASHATGLVLMVVELCLPRVSGSEFVKRLPTLAPRIPVLFMTGMGGYELPDRFSRQFPILQKPFNANTLIAVVNTLIPCV